MDKKIILFLFSVFLISFVQAESITAVIPSVVPFNQSLIISGHYNGDIVDGNVLCSFRIFDVYEDNRLIWRLSDEYTSADGFFNNSPFVLTDPVFQRGYDYNAVACCNTVCVDQNFSVIQKQDIVLGKTSESLAYDLTFFNNPDVFMLIFFLIVFGLVFYFALIKR